MTRGVVSVRGQGADLIHGPLGELRAMNRGGVLVRGQDRRTMTIVARTRVHVAFVVLIAGKKDISRGIVAEGRGS